MRRGLCTGVVIALVLLVATLIPTAQAQTVAAKANAASNKWTAPRTVDGQPDLQGVWANNNATPLERPAEVAALKAKAGELFSGDGDAAFGDDVFTAIVSGATKFVSSDAGTGNYNQFWIAGRDFDNRTSLITDPPDGRIPPPTPEAKTRRQSVDQDRNLRGFDGPE